MEKLPQDIILTFHSDTLEFVRKKNNLDKPGEMNKAIDTLEDWTKKQNHFTKKDISRDYLERLLVGNKGSVERAKARLDKLCTLRTLLQHFFEDFDVKEYARDNARKVYFAILPKLTDDHNRVFVAKHFAKQHTRKTISDFLKFLIKMTHYVSHHDYIDAYDIVIDFTEANLMELLTNCNVVELKQMIIIMMDGYGGKLKGIHLLSTSKAIDAVITLIKQVISEKLANRIHVHKTKESLYDFITKNVLPVDYGGEERPLSKLYAEWIDILSSEAFDEEWREMNRARTDESLRQTDTFNAQYMGMPGTFRTLSVD